MKRWWIGIALLLSVGVNVGILATIAVSRARRGDGPPPIFRQLERRLPSGADPAMQLARRLGVDPSQEHAFRQLHRRFFEETVKQRRRMQQARRRMVEELVSESPDQELLEQLGREVAEAQVSMEKALVETTLRSREALDPGREEAYLRFLMNRLQRMGQAQQQRQQRRR